MRKIVLIPETLEYRELSPLTFEEFCELFDFSGDPDDAYEHFLNSNDLFELDDIQDEHDDFELVITTGDTSYTFDANQVPTIGGGVVALVKDSPKQPVVNLKCAVIAVLELADDNTVLLYEGNNSWIKVTVDQVRQNAAIVFCLQPSSIYSLNVTDGHISFSTEEDVHIHVDTIAEEVITAFKAHTVKESNNRLVSSPNFRVPGYVLEDYSTFLRKNRLTSVDVNWFSGDWLTEQIHCPIMWDDSEFDNLYEAWMLVNVVFTCIVNFTRITPTNFNKFVAHLVGERYKVRLSENRLIFTGCYSSSSRDFIIDFNLNALAKHYAQYSKTLLGDNQC